MHPCSTPWKHQKTVEKACIGKEWVKLVEGNKFNLRSKFMFPVKEYNLYKRTRKEKKSWFFFAEILVYSVWYVFLIHLHA